MDQKWWQSATDLKTNLLKLDDNNTHISLLNHLKISITRWWIWFYSKWIGKRPRSYFWKCFEYEWSGSGHIITSSSNYAHISPILQMSHCLWVKQWSGLIISVYNLLSIKRLSRVVRSSNQSLLNVPVSRPKSKGDNGRYVIGLTLWNALSVWIRNLASRLNSSLFRLALSVS